MDIRIGILNAPRELSFETEESSADVTATVTAALEGNTGVLRLTDDKGAVYVVPTASIGYVQIGSEESRRVGFVA
ncbi:DUF3107 domain-containing protein [Rathayibacter soli]|uniref:DUF3107 domain-containing protein n=1 Tax=Rathayibacter soli TaxID=3144168 RepID=UPI0027E4F850|nr:DUF3107 domain-containing protein [Glaciibacter superstes]